MTDQPKVTFLHRTLSFFRRFFLLTSIIIVLAVLGFVFEVGRWSVYRVHPELTSTEQANAFLSKIGALIQLPMGETPTMATINDAISAKKAQPFLVNAANGDVLIVYQNAAEAFLYRPSTDKLIAVGPVDTGAGSQPLSQVQTSPKTVATSTPLKNATTNTQTKK